MRSSISLCGVTRGKGLEVELVPMKCVRWDDYWESSSQWWEIESSGGWVQPTNWYKTLMRRWLSYPKNIQLGVWFVSMSGDKWPDKKCNNAFDVNWANIQRSLLGGSGPITTRSGRLQSNVSGWGPGYFIQLGPVWGMSHGSWQTGNILISWSSDWAVLEITQTADSSSVGPGLWNVGCRGINNNRPQYIY